MVKLLLITLFFQSIHNEDMEGGTCDMKMYEKKGAVFNCIPTPDISITICPLNCKRSMFDNNEYLPVPAVCKDSQWTNSNDNSVIMGSEFNCQYRPCDTKIIYNQNIVTGNCSNMIQVKGGEFCDVKCISSKIDRSIIVQCKSNDWFEKSKQYHGDVNILQCDPIPVSCNMKHNTILANVNSSCENMAILNNGTLCNISCKNENERPLRNFPDNVLCLNGVLKNTWTNEALIAEDLDCVPSSAKGFLSVIGKSMTCNSSILWHQNVNGDCFTQKEWKHSSICTIGCNQNYFNSDDFPNRTELVCEYQIWYKRKDGIKLERIENYECKPSFCLISDLSLPYETDVTLSCRHQDFILNGQSCSITCTSGIPAPNSLIPTDINCLLGKWKDKDLNEIDFGGYLCEQDTSHWNFTTNDTDNNAFEVTNGTYLWDLTEDKTDDDSFLVDPDAWFIKADHRFPIYG